MTVCRLNLRDSAIEMEYGCCAQSDAAAQRRAAERKERWMENEAINVIGGADGSTAIFVTTAFSPWEIALWVLAGVAVVGALVWLWLRRKKRK